jgi:alginate O-acetyltransferase complex protein AlgI
MIEKVLIADTIARVIDPALQDYASLSTAGAWLCMVGYTYQLFFDFAGYSNMAVGLGLLFGLRIPQNFNSPYKAHDVSDFWRRWHISLSSCLRDYVYIPLGGNRGARVAVYRNLLLTMLLGGLWHGASWTFVAWGGYHGLLLGAYRWGGGYWDRLPRACRVAGTFALVLIGWVFFRSPTFEMAQSMLTTMFSFRDGPLMPGAVGLLAVGGIAAWLAHVAPNTFEISHRWGPWSTGVLAILFGLCLLAITSGQQSPFLYFQF